MEIVKGKGKKNLVCKAWERCCSLGSSSSASTTTSKSFSSVNMIIKSRLMTRMRRCSTAPTETRKVAPEGCFSVYVGPEKQRFVVRTEYANHPLFKSLLEDAETEYGFNSDGPILLPCDVDLFCKVLDEMESSSCCDDDDDVMAAPKCSLVMLRSPCRPKYSNRISSSTCTSSAGCGGYKPLRRPQSLLLKDQPHYFRADQ